MTGFRDVVPHEAMELFEVNEVLGQLCGDDRSENEPLWTAEEAKSILVGDHGYQNDSAQLSMLSNIIANRLTPKEQRAFLLFCTGCPRLPPGGLSALGAITVVKRSNAFDVARSLARQTLSTPIIQQQEGDDDDLEGSPLTLAMRDRSPEGDGDDPAEDPPPEDSGSSTTDVEGQSDLTQNGAMTNSSICQDDITQNMLSTDWSLPSVNTCFKYLKLPPYPEEELMYEKLLLAINHCTESFELS
ncbi:HECT-domain (ubiquitin-transferase), putative [Angomonas deanei]|uniref:HECT-domain (Ubiquitin-transferase), putative n=1 Tax=Angomonas deanei TaxID=59799 RepID=A0A7G2CA96_9TRYP|nr:HECT-domain (ubiquitin-transferase), putative [Angomonas deanei]